MEPSFASQLWRGVRFCLSLLLGITVLTVVFEEKGLGRGMLNNPDHRPEQVSNVRFTDVKGVDEAKVRPAWCVIVGLGDCWAGELGPASGDVAKTVESQCWAGGTSLTLSVRSSQGTCCPCQVVGWHACTACRLIMMAAMQPPAPLCCPCRQEHQA